MEKRKMAILASKLRICTVNEDVVFQTSEKQMDWGF